MDINNNLPLSETLNIVALSRIFRNTTNSYKFVFFISLLDILNRRRFDVQKAISFYDLTVEMLANTWFPHTFFKLSFGTQDTITQKLDSLILDIDEPVLRFHDSDKKLLRKAITSTDLSQAVRLMEFVPYRLLSPFMEEELKNINKAAWGIFENAMPAITNRHFNSKNPLYRFDSDNYNECQNIFFNPLWADYFKRHFTIIYGWASWHWLQYMQKRNPSTPNIANKLFMPSKRGTLGKQKSYWKKILETDQGQQLRCIYTNQALRADNFSLDHYLPWSFVAHDQLWNLIPTEHAVNSSKSNNLPAAHYFNGFVQTQHRGLLIAKMILSKQEFEKQTEPYISDLKIAPSDLFNFAKLQTAYSQAINPLTALALNQGYCGGWQYTNRIA